LIVLKQRKMSLISLWVHYGQECTDSTVSLCTPLFDQLIHSALLECIPSLKQTLLQLWQNEVTLNTHCNVS